MYALLCVLESLFTDCFMMSLYVYAVVYIAPSFQMTNINLFTYIFPAPLGKLISYICHYDFGKCAFAHICKII